MCIYILEKVDGVTLKEWLQRWKNLIFSQFLGVSSTLGTFMDNNIYL